MDNEFDINNLLKAVRVSPGMGTLYDCMCHLSKRMDAMENTMKYMNCMLNTMKSHVDTIHTTDDVHVVKNKSPISVSPVKKGPIRMMHSTPTQTIVPVIHVEKIKGRVPFTMSMAMAMVAPKDKIVKDVKIKRKSKNKNKKQKRKKAHQTSRNITQDSMFKKPNTDVRMNSIPQQKKAGIHNDWIWDTVIIRHTTSETRWPMDDTMKKFLNTHTKTNLKYIRYSPNDNKNILRIQFRDRMEAKKVHDMIDGVRMNEFVFQVYPALNNKEFDPRCTVVIKDVDTTVSMHELKNLLEHSYGWICSMRKLAAQVYKIEFLSSASSDTCYNRSYPLHMNGRELVCERYMTKAWYNEGDTRSGWNPMYRQSQIYDKENMHNRYIESDIYDTNTNDDYYEYQ